MAVNFVKNMQEKHESDMVWNTIPVIAHHQINLAVVQKKELRQDLVYINKKTEVRYKHRPHKEAPRM